MKNLDAQNPTPKIEQAITMGALVPLPKGYQDKTCPNCNEKTLIAKKLPNEDEQDPIVKCSGCGFFVS